jgi:Ca2+-binding EF-hand superfamily protein
MQISSTPTAYGGGDAQRLLSLLLQQQGAQAGQDVPGADSTSAATTPSPTQPSGGTSAAQFTSDTLSSLLSAQEAPPTSSDVAAKVISTADTNGDGSLSLAEIEKALGQDTTSGASGADALSQAFSKLDTNGDGQVSADELSSALDAQKSASVAQNAPSDKAQKAHAHHGHHAASSSTDVASQMLGAADTNGDGQLSASELQTALGSSSSDSLTSAIGTLDTNGDGQLSATELSAAIDAFRAAHDRGGSTTNATNSSTQAVTA